MATLDGWNTESIKALNVGKPGAGKTGALISIVVADPEARLFIANFDRGNFGTLANVARFDPKTKQPRPPEVVERLLTKQIFYHNFEDKIQVINGQPMIVGNPQAFAELGRKLNDWGDGLGGLASWGPKDWFVYDSISAFCESGMRAALARSGRLNRRPEQSDWGEAINQCALLLEMTNDTSIKCNIMANTHVRFVGDPETMGADGKAKELDMVPNALGQKLPQEIGRYFNNILETRVVGQGPGERRLIHTRSPGGLVLRTSNPAMVKPDYPLEDGMAQWVRDLRSVPTVAAAPAAVQPPTGAPAAN